MCGYRPQETNGNLAETSSKNIYNGSAHSKQGELIRTDQYTRNERIFRKIEEERKIRKEDRRKYSKRKTRNKLQEERRDRRKEERKYGQGNTDEGHERTQRKNTHQALAMNDQTSTEIILQDITRRNTRSGTRRPPGDWN